MRTEINTLIAILSATTLASQAAIVLTGDSSGFDYKYEMDTAPNNQDLDSNSADDWFDTGAPTVSGGLASITNSGTNAQIFRGDFALSGNPSIWRALVSAGAAADWTLELSVRKDGGTQGSGGWFGIATANLTESNSSALTIMDDRIRLTGGSDYLVGSDFTSGFQTIRIAHDAVDNAYYYWVNGILLNADLSTPIAGTNGGAFDNSTFIGDYSGSLAGDWSIDYIRLDTDAIGVIPEPSAAFLGSLGALMLLRRRR